MHGKKVLCSKFEEKTNVDFFVVVFRVFWRHSNTESKSRSDIRPDIRYLASPDFRPNQYPVHPKKLFVFELCRVFKEGGFDRYASRVGGMGQERQAKGKATTLCCMCGFACRLSTVHC
jgi:hypothetical protein